MGDFRGKLRVLLATTTFERWTATITAAATAFVAASVVIAAFAYWAQERAERLKRTFDFMTQAEGSIDEWERKQIVSQFPGRWQRDVEFCLSAQEAQKFLEVALRPTDDISYIRWNLARKYLNRMETLAFPYVYNLVDREIVATSSCEAMTKSNKYFQHLINIFGDYLGGGQSWQVIPKSVEMMENAWGKDCMHLRSERRKLAIGQAEKQSYELPKPMEKPGEGESNCPQVAAPEYGTFSEYVTQFVF